MTKGLDLGTGFICGVRVVGDDNYEYAPIRNTFLALERNPMVVSMLRKSNVPTVELEGKLYAIGDVALQMASAFNATPSRPMRKGVINPQEVKALPIIKAIIDRALSFNSTHPKDEVVVFSVPANPVDETFNAVYHEGVFTKILTSFGYRAYPLNEGLAVIYSELLDANLSGIGISFGAGMVNVACAIYGQEVFSFSVATSGDFIDSNVAEALAITPLKALKAKEGMKDLTQPKDNVEQAIQFYYKHMLKYVIDHIVQKLNSLNKMPEFEAPPAVAIAGGTSIPRGFTTLFENMLREALPIELGEVKQSPEPLKAIAKGCLFYALSM